MRLSKAVPKKPFILSVESSTYACVQIHVHLLTRGITSETYIMVYVDKNTLHLPCKIKDNVENKIRSMPTHAYSLKPKINLKLSIAVKGQIHMNLSKLK